MASRQECAVEVTRIFCPWRVAPVSQLAISNWQLAIGEHQHAFVMERFFRCKQRAFFKSASLRCALALRAARKETYLVRYPALSRSVPQRTRDEASRAGLNNFAPSQKTGRGR
jgi:hypothetical protein